MSKTSQRDSNGRFKRGNKVAIGHQNPQARRRQALSDEFMKQVKLTDFKKIVKKLIEMAKGGDLPAIKEVLDRALGKPIISEDEPENLHISVKFPPELQNM